MNRPAQVLIGFVTACLILVLALVTAVSFDVLHAQDKPDRPILLVCHQYSGITFSGGVSADWLKIQRRNLNGYEDRGFDPSYTLIQSDFRPLVQKAKDGTYEITFVSDIAQSQP